MTDLETISSSPFADAGSLTAQELDRLLRPGSGMVPNNEAGAVITSVLLSDPSVRLIAAKIAQQMNDQSAAATTTATSSPVGSAVGDFASGVGSTVAAAAADKPLPRPVFTDLSDRIADIVFETSAQGSSFIEVHLIDPQLWLLRSEFITVDEDGFLWPPIEVNFPPDNTGAKFRLAEVRFQTVSGAADANLVLTFEDRIVSILRETDGALGGIKQSTPSQTLAGFMTSLVEAAAKAFHDHIGVEQLIAPQDPNFNAPTPPASTSATTPATPSSFFSQTTQGTGASALDAASAAGAAASSSSKVADSLRKFAAEAFGVGPSSFANLELYWSEASRNNFG